MADFTKYNFQEKQGLAKNKLVLEVIRQYVKDNPQSTYIELKEAFPDNLQGNTGVIKNRADLDAWAVNRNEDDPKRKRFFTDNKELISIAIPDDEIYVCTQWGADNLEKFLQRVRDIGYEITESINNTESTSSNIPDTNPSEENKMTMKTKNIILYGAPGVGKTYNHKKLVSLIENEDFTQNEMFEFVKTGDNSQILEGSVDETFEEVLKEDRLKFVTFHQSYSYEDFIEGFRPNEDGNIVREDGVFKTIADAAQTNLTASRTNQIKKTFRELLSIYLADLEDDKLLKVNMKTTGKYFKIYDVNENTIYFEKKNEDRSHTLALKTLEKMYEKGFNDFHFGGLKGYYEPILNDLLLLKEKLTISEDVQEKKYYLIIDEINRGNISKIFGELITLIEDDKRGILKAELPYSRKSFTVPKNLYIIATMNTTDKSIALLDVALRRRFTFIKMLPIIEVIQFVPARELLTKLNEKILERKGEDYLIGHGYFTDVLNDEDFEFVKNYKIVPLLEEYFYSDEESLKELTGLLEN